jgi:formylglycine-generating enzyme
MSLVKTTSHSRPRALLAAITLAACSAGPPPPAPAPPPLPPAPPPPTVSLTPSSGPTDAGAAEDAAALTSSAPTPPEPPSACPAGMKLVDTTYCPDVKRRCLKDEYNKPNHITICHEFAPGTVCLGKERRQRFCVDEYEYPNQKGAHPPVMVSWYDGNAACAAEGKRLCWESEWVSACEGPDHLPFPYGLKRDPAVCNIDNVYVKPHLDLMYSAKPEVAGKELLQLDQSVSSGEKPGCASGFGVHDLTGNVDEWVNAEETHKVSPWAGLKGGAWGHVRNACRPMTTSHPPEFTYYFISFRCCKDAAPDAAADRDPAMWKPPPYPDHPGGKAGAGWTTRERGPNRPGSP